MEKNTAQDILIQAARIGQKHGIYSLEDASAILLAINTLQKNATHEVKEQKSVPDEHKKGNKGGKTS